MNEMAALRPMAVRTSVLLAVVAFLSPWGPFGRPGLLQPAYAQSGAKKGTSVEVVQPSQRDIVRELRLPGSLIADEQVDLYAKISGYVSEIHVDIGDRVAKGDVLAVISVPEMAGELQQAQAALHAKQARVRALEAKVVQAQRMIETARAQVKRYVAEHELGQINLKRKQELHEGNAIPEQALDEARSAYAITEAQLQIAKAGVAGAGAEKMAVDADVQVARAEVLVAQADLGRLQTIMQYATITAPFDGVIAVRNIDHGTFVRSAEEGTTTPLLRIAKTDRIRLVVEIPEVDARYVGIGTEVQIDIKALGGDPRPGAVSRTAGTLKPNTRTMRAEIDLDNKDGRLAPGMFAHVLVKLEQKKQATVIPSKAIRVLDGKTIVLVAANGEAQARPVQIGYDDGIWAEVLSGLSANDQVITSTSGAVTPGSGVTPVSLDS